MARRRMTLKRIDPWSVLKFGFVANVALLGIILLGLAIIWWFIRRLELIEKVCDIAISVGFVECGVNGGNLFRAVLLIGVLGVVIMTGLVVFFAFLTNLINDLTGGLSFSFEDDTPTGTVRTTGGAATLQRTEAQPAAKAPAPLGTTGGSGSAGSTSSTAATGQRVGSTSDGATGGGGSAAAPRPLGTSGGSSSPATPPASTPGGYTPPSSPTRPGGGSSGGSSDLFGDRPGGGRA